MLVSSSSLILMKMRAVALARRRTSAFQFVAAACLEARTTRIRATTTCLCTNSAADGTLGGGTAQVGTTFWSSRFVCTNQRPNAAAQHSSQDKNKNPASQEETASSAATGLPAGWAWGVCQLLGGSWLACPPGWHFAKAEQNTQEGVTAYFVSKERLGASENVAVVDDDNASRLTTTISSSSFSTGLTVRFYQDLRESMGMSPSKYAAQCMELIAMSPRRKVLTQCPPPEEEEEGPGSSDGSGRSRDAAASAFMKQAMEYREVTFDPAHPQPIRVYLAFYSNPRTGGLYEVVFESPEDLWHDAWLSFGQTMTSHIALNCKL